MPSVPARAGPVLALTVATTVAGPAIVERFNEIQSALLEIAHAHALGPVTAIGTSPPVAGTVADSGATVKLQSGAGGSGGGEGGGAGDVCGGGDPAACWITVACASDRKSVV